MYTWDPNRDLLDDVDRYEILWRVTGPGMAEASLLLGTIHIACRTRWMWRVERFLQKNAEWLATELVAECVSKPAPDDTAPCREALDADAPIAIAAGTVGLSATTLAQLQPIAAWFTLIAAAAPDPAHRIVDARLVSRADKLGVSVRGIEATNEVGSELCSLPRDVQMQALLETSASLAAATPDQREAAWGYMRRHYGDGYAPPIVVRPSSWRWPPEFLDILIHRRNARMTEHFLSLATAAPGVAAVGAAHLYGETGLLSSLRRAGMQVDAIPVHVLGLGRGPIH